MQSETARRTRSLYKDRVAVSLYVSIIALLAVWWVTHLTSRYVNLGWTLLLIAIVLFGYVLLRPVVSRLGPNGPRILRRIAIIACVAIVVSFCFLVYLISAGL
jgi:hypothetical protein